MRIRPIAHAERRGAPRWMTVSLTIVVMALGATAGQVEFVHRGVDGRIGVAVGALLAVLVLWGFPSLPLRSTGRLTVLLSAGIIARQATLDPVPGDGIDIVALWLVAAVATFVFTDRITTAAAPEAVDIAPAERPRRERGRMLRTWAITIVLAAMAVLSVAVVAPFANERFSSARDAGSPATGDRDSASSSLRHSDRLDLSHRPELTDEILLTVRSEHRSFLRGQVYDRWDGNTWSRTDPERFRVAGSSIHTDEHDLGAAGTLMFTQRIRLEADWADLYLAAPTAVRLETTGGAVQTLDGTLSAWPEPLGRGAVYTVTSRTHPVDAELLRAAGDDVPDEIRDRYTARPPTTDRVRELGEQIVADSGAATTYDRIRAFEAWMGDNLEYSLDAPPSPENVDAVDRFLFEDRLGWCEQIASSLIVFARAEGIPARMATGFVASERDRITGDLVVRAKHAHAWAEVWFPEFGWVPFDPTADVPLAPEADAERSLLDLLRERLGLIAGAILAIGAIGWMLVRFAPRLRSRRASRPSTEIARLDRDLDRLGAQHGLERRPDESAGPYADRLGRHLGEPEVGAAGQLVDQHLYSGEAPSAERISAVRDRITNLISPMRRVRT